MGVRNFFLYVFLYVFLVGALMLLAGCASPRAPEPVIVTREVRVPVPVPCNPQLGPKPAFPDSDVAIAEAGTIFDLAKLYRAGRGLRDAWIAELESALNGCRG